MPRLMFETIVESPLEAVWAFHDDPGNLVKISPPEMELRLESADVPVREGSVIEVSLRGPLGRRMSMRTRIVRHRPPHAVVFGAEGFFVDEMRNGVFGRWRHEHEFEAVDSTRTRIVDRVSYRLVGWPLSWPVERLLVRPRIRRMFRYRERAFRQLLESVLEHR